MRSKYLGAALLVAVMSATNAFAQRPLAIEVGAFGQYNAFDKNLQIDNTVTGGGRLGLYLLKNLAIEGDLQYGKADWNGVTPSKSLTLMPWAARFVYGIPLGERWKFLLGAGYQQNVYDGRTKLVGSTEAPNEYEDAISGLVGLKVCLNQKWNLRFDVPVDYDPSPNFTGDESLNGTSTNFGFRVGLGTMLRGDCIGTPFDWTLAVTPPASTHKPGEKQALAWSARDNKEKAITQQKIRGFNWTSSNTGVATVDQTGNMTAVAPGSAEIKLCGTIGKLERCASHSATVREMNWSTAISPTSGTANVGQSLTFTATATNEENAAMTGTWTWASSNAAVATVDNGTVRCVSGGNVTITATFTPASGQMATGTKSSTATVTCNAPPPQAILVVRLSEKVLFAFNRSTLSRGGRDTLNSVLGQLSTGPGANWVISVEGHTDPYASEAYNQKLSERRAATVYDYFTKSPGKLDPSRISQSAFGERCLVLEDDHAKPKLSKAEHAVNRRVEIWNLNGSTVPTDCRTTERR